ncbi:MAG: hypothetical protein JXA11_01640 [Phycisphaerae bacterium]|nr:hypothetical protein [Phycisphaerae bacterium]
MNVNAVVDQYQKVRSGRESRTKQFLDGSRKYLIFQTPDGNVWSDARTPEECFERNIEYVEKSLDIPSDHLPLMEPWFGTGVYANMYGCEYVWRDGEAPAVHYLYHQLDEVVGLAKPRWQDSPVARLVLETIRYFKSKLGDALPIVWTDTQSASDTGTLILDACEVFTGCLLEPEKIEAFLRQINSLIIEFSNVQAEEIGEALLSPGHIFLSGTGFAGMSISDDNLAVSSPRVNERFNLPLAEEIGRAMDGVAIHSCGNYAHTMGRIKELVPSCVALDCALDHVVDPNPNSPEAVRDALVGSNMAVHVRMTGRTEAMLEIVRRVMHPDLRLVVHPSYIDDETAERNYAALDSLLSGMKENVA